MGKFNEYVEEALVSAKEFIELYDLFCYSKNSWKKMKKKEKEIYKNFDEYMEVCLRKYFLIKMHEKMAREFGADEAYFRESQKRKGGG